MQADISLIIYEYEAILNMLVYPIPLYFLKPLNMLVNPIPLYFLKPLNVYISISSYDTSILFKIKIKNVFSN